MKHRRLTALLAVFTATVIAFACVACDKKTIVDDDDDRKSNKTNKKDGITRYCGSDDCEGSGKCPDCIVILADAIRVVEGHQSNDGNNNNNQQNNQNNQQNNQNDQNNQNNQQDNQNYQREPNADDVQENGGGLVVSDGGEWYVDYAFDNGVDKGTYTGHLMGNNIRHGYGTFEYENGDVYAGSWVDDKYAGQGTLTLADGSSYDCAWTDGKRNGWGTHKDANGKMLYHGNYEDDKEVD